MVVVVGVVGVCLMGYDAFSFCSLVLFGDMRDDRVSFMDGGTWLVFIRILRMKLGQSGTLSPKRGGEGGDAIRGEQEISVKNAISGRPPFVRRRERDDNMYEPAADP